MAMATDDNVIVEKMELLFEGRDPFVIDLTQSQTEEPKLRVKEGVEYKIRLTFRVNHRIVSGLRYHHRFEKKGLVVDKDSVMIGSYSSKDESHTFVSRKVYETPKGMIARGAYLVSCKVIDDDKIIIKDWTWWMDVHKDWE